MSRCTATLVLDYDSLGCTAEAGHTGPHVDRGEGGGFLWLPQQAIYEQLVRDTKRSVRLLAAIERAKKGTS